MTDIMAAIGLVQLERYPSLLKRRREIIEKYNAGFEGTLIKPLVHLTEDKQSSMHLYITHLQGYTLEQRNEVIQKWLKQALRAMFTTNHYLFSQPIKILALI